MGAQPLNAIRQKVVAFLGYPQTLDDKVDYWRQEIDRQANKFGFWNVTEVSDLRTRVPEYLSRGDEEHLRHAVSRIDPRVNISYRASVLVYHESRFDQSLLSPSTVFDFHFPVMRESVALIGVKGKEVRFFDEKRKTLAIYIASGSVPEEAVLQSGGRFPTVAQLVMDYTGFRFGVEDLIRMDQAFFRKQGQHWFMMLGS